MPNPNRVVRGPTISYGTYIRRIELCDNLRKKNKQLHGVITRLERKLLAVRKQLAGTQAFAVRLNERLEALVKEAKETDKEIYAVDLTEASKALNLTLHEPKHCRYCGACIPECKTYCDQFCMRAYRKEDT